MLWITLSTITQAVTHEKRQDYLYNSQKDFYSTDFFDVTVISHYCLQSTIQQKNIKYIL